MRLTLASNIIIMCCLISGCSNRSHSVREYSIIDTCFVLENSETYNGKEIEISAQVNTDFSHYVWLEDPKCDGKAIFFARNSSVKFKTPPEYSEFMKKKQAEGGTVVGVFRGFYHYDPDMTPQNEIFLTDMTAIKYYEK